MGEGYEAVNICYADSRMSDFFWVPAGISAFGILLNMVPQINRWVERVHAEAVVNNRKSAMEQEANQLKAVLGDSYVATKDVDDGSEKSA